MRIAVAMSGGINSLLIAVLMKQVGYDIIAVTAEFPETDPEIMGNIYNGKPASCGYIFSARRNSKKYKIPHKIIRLEETFYTEIHNFYDSGEAKYIGKEIEKQAVLTRLLLEKLAEFTKTIGCQRLATGHYARIKRKENGIFYVAEGLDKCNDESQRLSLLSQELLGFVMFPLGEYHWGAVEKMIKRNKLTETKL